MTTAATTTAHRYETIGLSTVRYVGRKHVHVASTDDRSAKIGASYRNNKCRYCVIGAPHSVDAHAASVAAS